MTGGDIVARLRKMLNTGMPLPGFGQTALRHRRLMELGREDLSLARLAEAHWDAVAILAEAGRRPEPGAIYGVWASEKAGSPITASSYQGRLSIEGSKMFCSGAGLIDRVLLTVNAGESRLLEVDLRGNADAIEFDDSGWKTGAFSATRTSTAHFSSIVTVEGSFVGPPGWYVERAGFWHGACGPAACWAGGAIGLVDYALRQRREDAHTLAHLGAMTSLAWALRAYIYEAGREIDRERENIVAARMRALMLRHLVEQACTEILTRLPRAYGPYPLAMDEAVARRYQELDLYLRQSHAERDLESLGRDMKRTNS